MNFTKNASKLAENRFQKKSFKYRVLQEDIWQSGKKDGKEKEFYIDGKPGLRHYSRRRPQGLSVGACYKLLRRKVFIFFREVFFMSKSIYVGNLPWSATEEQVQDLFASYGTVHSVKLITDRETGRARGFGFVEMDDAEASAAIEALDNSSFGGRTLRVNEARPKDVRGPRG